MRATVGATVMLSSIAPVTLPCLYAWDWTTLERTRISLKQCQMPVAVGTRPRLAVRASGYYYKPLLGARDRGILIIKPSFSPTTSNIAGSGP